MLIFLQEQEHAYVPTLKAHYTEKGLSVVDSLAKFRRGFRIFTMGSLANVDLGLNTAVVTGGSVAACMAPW